MLSVSPCWAQLGDRAKKKKTPTHNVAWSRNLAAGRWFDSTRASLSSVVRSADEMRTSAAVLGSLPALGGNEALSRADEVGAQGSLLISHKVAIGT